MVSDIIKAPDKELRKISNSAPHYPEGAEEMNTFDGDADIDRAIATLAQKAIDGKNNPV